MAVIDTKENRDIATVNIPNAFVQTKVEDNNDESKVIIKIWGPLVNMLVEMAPDMYTKFVITERRSQGKVLYVWVLKAIYGMLKSALLFYRKLWKDLEQIGFKVNPYDPCVANWMVNGK